MLWSVTIQFTYTFTRFNIFSVIIQASDIIPDSLTSAMMLLVMDQALVHCLPQTRSVLRDYLEKLDHEKYQLYQNALQVCEALESSAKFLKESKKQVCNKYIQMFNWL